MADKKRLAKQPMLYIAQPNFKPAEVPMQTSFRSQRANKSSSSSNAAESTSLYEKELRIRNQNASTAPEQKKEPEVEEKKEEKQEPVAEQPKKRMSSSEKKKRFGELTLEGKVEYFLQLSPHMPKMKCEVIGKEDSYKGYILDYTDGIVQMKTFQRPFQQDVPFKDIEDIRLLGF
ncbi:spore coat CotO family protein [Halobacillus litoralis]|uniref:CotO family spore coat protein n=1 Tax=Halobacillus litoralis TaxID=45668 RepID=UPI001CD7B381|nr:CotO family spore coat protein [Halobacillus litoralis]MCA0969567.1 spore coat CotO family protein [Halobacillus litoralis]